MAVPLVYNIRSVKVRWISNLVAVLGIAGVVSVFVGMFSMAKGFQATLVESGLPDNVMVRRGGATSEMDSVVTLNEVKAISDAPGIARNKDGRPLPECTPAWPRTRGSIQNSESSWWHRCRSTEN